jgi:antitoxin MazE
MRKLGPSTGVIIPRSLPDDLGLSAGDTVQMRLEEGCLVVAPVRRPARTDWAEAARAIAAASDDSMAWPEFAIEGDDELTW